MCMILKQQRENLVLLVNGCSFTYGDELEGHDQTPPTHFPLTFGNLLADKLNTDCVNLAIRGSSNARIFRTTMQYLMENPPPEYMVLLWSSWSRLEFYRKRVGVIRQVEKHQYNIGMRGLDDVMLTKEEEDSYDFFYNKIQNIETGIFNGLNQMKYIQWIADMLGIKLLQGVFSYVNHQQIMYVLSKTGNNSPFYKKKIRDSIGYLRPECRIGLGYYKDFRTVAEEIDGILEFNHPNAESHKIFSEILFDAMKEKKLC